MEEAVVEIGGLEGQDGLGHQQSGQMEAGVIWEGQVFWRKQAQVYNADCQESHVCI